MSYKPQQSRSDCRKKVIIHELRPFCTLKKASKASILAHYPDSNERLNGFDLVILDLVRFLDLVCIRLCLCTIA